MSRTFSGELHSLEDKAWKPYTLLSRYPIEFKPTCDAVLSMIGSLHLLRMATEDHRLSSADERKLHGILGACSNNVSSLQSALSKIPSDEGNSKAVDDVRLDILESTKDMSLFLEVIRQYSKETISNALGDIRRVNNPDFQRSIEVDWGFLTSELVKHGCAVNVVDEEFFFIEQWLKEHPHEVMEDSESASMTTATVVQGEEITGSHRPFSTSFPPTSSIEGSDGMILQSPDQMARNSVRRKPVKSSTPASQSSTLFGTMDTPYIPFSNFAPDSGLIVHTEPDPYNGLIVQSPSIFDKDLVFHGNIQNFDDGLMVQGPYTAQEIKPDGLIAASNEFEEYIEAAVNDEACRLLIEQERHPQNCPQPYFWLPKNLQPTYMGADAEYIISKMDQKSFSVMAYQTAPKLSSDIQRLKHLLVSSSATGKMGSNDGVISDAFRCLETMCFPLPKFNFLRSSNPILENFSDLDVLEFECSTIDITNSPDLFPKTEFDLAQQSYWKLLTHLMGLIQAITDIFQGRAYITRSRLELEFLWSFHNINSQTAWLESQLADWDKIENAVRFCRHWHSQQLNLRDQAVRMLQDWKSAQRILMGGEGIDIIELTMVSAEDLPKYSFSRPSTFTKIRFYRRNLHGRAEVSLVLSTKAAPPGRIAIWDKPMKINVPRTARYIDVEIHHSMTAGNQILGHAQLSFTFPPGGEATFMNRSLMYGIDENIGIKVPCTQSKTNEPVLLNIGIKWSGRYNQVERAGLPTRPPGKMFRTDISGIPAHKEEKVEGNTANGMGPGASIIRPAYNEQNARIAAVIFARPGGSPSVINAFS